LNEKQRLKELGSERERDLRASFVPHSQAT
jgi:hypothetical protein